MIFVYALKKNPSVSEAQSKFAMMKDDMGKLMSVGGKVVSSHQRSKYGGALIHKTLSDEGWSDDLIQKYEGILIERNWRKLVKSYRQYCKDGVLAEIEPNSGMHNGQGANGVSMTFDASTIEKCKFAV
jgi:hypothetical protein